MSTTIDVVVQSPSPLVTLVVTVLGTIIAAWLQQVWADRAQLLQAVVAFLAMELRVHVWHIVVFITLMALSMATTVLVWR